MRFKKIISLGLAAMMSMSVMCTFANAQESGSNVINISENELNCWVADGEVGTEYHLSNGLVYKVIDEDTYNKFVDKVERMEMSRTKKYSWSLTDLSVLGTLYDKEFRVTSSYPYWHVAINNTQSSSKKTTMYIFDTDGGLDTSIEVPGNKIGWLYSTGEYEAGYYTVRFSSVSTLSGSAYGFSSNTLSDVVFDG